MRHFKLGQFLRRRYGKLLGHRYSAKDVYIQSTDVDRTIMSALANVAGLFAPTAEEVWNRDILWQPIPVHTIPERNDNAYKDCPKYNFAIEKYVKESPEVQRIYTEYADLFAYWSKMCGLSIATTSDVYRLHNTLLVESENNKTFVSKIVHYISDTKSLFVQFIYICDFKVARMGGKSHPTEWNYGIHSNFGYQTLGSHVTIG